MKKLTLSIFILIVSYNLFCQTEHYVFCEIVAAQIPFSKKVTISIDFGQEQKMFKSTVILDENNNPVKFNSLIDALNFFGELEWELNGTMLLSSGNTQVYHFIMQKKIKEGEIIEFKIKK